MVLWKALFLEKRILIYSKTPSACSTFIHTLISLFPNLCNFKFDSEALHLSEVSQKNISSLVRIIIENMVCLLDFCMINVCSSLTSASKTWTQSSQSPPSLEEHRTLSSKLFKKSTGTCMWISTPTLLCIKMTL
jgi:Transport protein Avl9